MNEQEFYTKTKETVVKFKNGEKRYRESALFNQVVQSLVRGADAYEIIDSLINVADDSINALKQYMHRTAPPMIMREG